MSDWLGENNSSSRLYGFEFRGGQNPETHGIRLWSEIFTHDYDNGEKVAIILIDTQGVFVKKSSFHECTTIFTLSALLSSVQCFNIMQNIEESDFQHLDWFTEYGRSRSQLGFQKLLFIVRDWPYSDENEYGWNSDWIEKILDGKDEHTNEMQELRQRIQSSFEKIDAFLMPHPGLIVAQGKNFTGNVQQISIEFRQYIKQLVVGLFAPQNLIVKMVNGQKMRARDLIQYLGEYLNIFISDELPAPSSILIVNIFRTLSNCNHLFIQKFF